MEIKLKRLQKTAEEMNEVMGLKPLIGGKEGVAELSEKELLAQIKANAEEVDPADTFSKKTWETLEALGFDSRGRKAKEESERYQSEEEPEEDEEEKEPDEEEEEEKPAKKAKKKVADEDDEESEEEPDEEEESEEDESEEEESEEEDEKPAKKSKKPVEEDEEEEEEESEEEPEEEEEEDEKPAKKSKKTAVKDEEEETEEEEEEESMKKTAKKIEKKSGNGKVTGADLMRGLVKSKASEKEIKKAFTKHYAKLGKKDPDFIANMIKAYAAYVEKHG